MTQTPAADARRLSEVADDLREVFAERGHRVDIALDTDPAFGSGNSRSSLRRDLALDTIAAAAGRAGLDFRNVQGGREVRTLTESVDRRYRLLKALRRPDGEFYIPTNSDSALAFSEGSLFDQERWCSPERSLPMVSSTTYSLPRFVATSRAVQATSLLGQ